MTPKQKLIEAILSFHKKSEGEYNDANYDKEADLACGKIHAYEVCLSLIEEILPE